MTDLRCFYLNGFINIHKGGEAEIPPPKGKVPAK